MRFPVLFCATVMAFIPAVIMAEGEGEGEGQDAKPITTAEAVKKFNEKCTVEMKVGSVGKSGGVFFLNSKQNFKDAGNFTVFINKDGAKDFKHAKIDDVPAHFKGKTIVVTGTVVLYNERPEIVVEKAEQVRIVEEKKAESKDEKKADKK